MPIKKEQVALHVRVKLNETFQVNSLADKYLKEEEWLFISDGHLYNDVHGGYYVHVHGASGCNSGDAYLSELELQYPIPEHLR